MARPHAGVGHQARDLYNAYTRDVTASDLKRLFTRETREAYEYFARGIDRSGLDDLRGTRRFLTHFKLFLVAFAVRLSPARRALYGAALVASLIAVLSLFNGIGFLEINGRTWPFPVLKWSDGTFWVVLALGLLNVLVILEVADRLSLKHDLTVAREIQVAMLPGGTITAQGLEAEGETRPANTVGGDFYDIVPTPDGRVLIALGDVAGKGSPAALLMALVVAILRTLVDARLALPEMVTRLNSQVLRHAPHSRFVTLFLGLYDPQTRTLTYVNAGHLPPLVHRAGGTIQRLLPTSIALGMPWLGPIEVRDATLEAGDLLVLYSDGITEAESAHGVPFDESGLEDVLRQTDGETANRIVSQLFARIEAHIGEARVADDLTVLALRVS
jgi:phosphoserine phosphatase RsbU/P